MLRQFFTFLAAELQPLNFDKMAENTNQASSPVQQAVDPLPSSEPGLRHQTDVGQVFEQIKTTSTQDWTI